MKQRVIYMDGKYWPQHKFFWLFWLFYVEYDGEHDIHFQVSFNSLEEAKEFCQKQKHKDKPFVLWSE